MKYSTSVVCLIIFMDIIMADSHTCRFVSECRFVQILVFTDYCYLFETGRYQVKKDPNTECFRKLNVEERTCLIYNTGDIENETHFLRKCSAYEIPRLNLYSIIEKKFPNFLKMSDEDKLNIILKSHDKELVGFICDLC